MVSDQTTASEGFHAGMGFSVVSDQAFAIGVTAVPTPMSDIDSDLFFVYETLIGRIEVGTNVGSSLSQSKTWDSKVHGP